MALSRKITIFESKNTNRSTLPIRTLFDVGPVTSSNSLTTKSQFLTAENSLLRKKLISSTTNDSGELPTIVDTYEYFSSNTNLTTADWESFVSGNLRTNILTDTFSIIDGFYDVNDALNTGINEAAYVANINFEYNFLIETYEQQISFPQVDEKLLPNMYAVMYAKNETEVGSQEKTFNNIVTLDNIINSTQTYSLQNKALTNKTAKGEYHDLYAKALLDVRNGRITKPQGFQNITGPMRNVVIPPEQLSYLRDLNAYKELYPMYNEINITMDKFSSFSTLLRDSNLTLSLINYIINNENQAVERIYRLSEQTVVYNSDVNTGNFSLKTSIPFEKGQIANVESSVNSQTIKTFDILDWWSKTKEDFTPSETNKTNTLVLGVEGESQKIANKNYEFARNLSYIIFYGKLRKLAKITQRNFNQIISGDSCYTETVFYKVTKHRVGIETPIQTFWIPNSADFDTFQFIDTQVKYNVDYEYRIYAYNLNIASSVTTTSEINTNSSIGNTSILEYTMAPQFLLVETLVYKITNKVVDDPPLSPEILVIPFKNINNKIKFFFNNSTGEEYSQFYNIDTNEANDFKKNNTMFTTLPTTKIKFKSDDIASAFEVYRTTTKPTRYPDFSDSLLTTISTDYDKKTFTKASSASYLDTILPNTKYYYIFRAIDYHGHISNPTDVYEIEMVDDDGAIYLRTNILSLKDLKLNKQQEKTFKKLIYIKPDIVQTLLNTDTITNLGITSAYDIYTLGNNGLLGIADSSVWDKKFKLRFVSKKTGKMFDLNLQMELEIDKENL